MYNLKKSLMKQTAITTMVVIAAFAVSAPSYATSSSLSLDDKMSVSLSQGSLSDALQQLSKQAGFQLSGNADYLKGDISALEGSYTAKEAIAKLLDTARVAYKWSDDALMITGRKPASLKISYDTEAEYEENFGVYDDDEKRDDVKTEEMEEIVVRGSYTVDAMNNATGLNMSLRETPQSVSIVTTQQIEDFALTDIGDVLAQISGITMVGDASEDSIIKVRGFSLDGGVQVDGMITTTASSGYSASISQGMGSVIAERVVVLKGAAGILSGLGEPSATVNMIRKRPTEEFKAYVLGGFGSWSSFNAEADISGPLTESGNVRARLVGSYENSGSFLDRYGRNKFVVYGIVEADLTESTVVSLAVDHVNSNVVGVYNWNSNAIFYTDGTEIEVRRGKSTGQDWTFRDMRNTSIMPEITHVFDNGWEVKAAYRYGTATIDVLNAGFGGYVYKDTNEFYAPYGGGEAGLSDRYSKTHSFNIHTKGDFSLFGREHEAIVGFNSGSNVFDRKTDYFYLPPYNYVTDEVVPEPDLTTPDEEYHNRYEQSQTGFFGTLRLSLTDSLKAMVGGRLSSFKKQSFNVKTGVDGDIIKDSNIFTPYAGLVLEVSDNASIYTSYTGIFKPNGAHDADDNVLAPVKGYNAEAGVKFAFYDDKLNLSVAVYRAYKKNHAKYAGLGKNANGNYIYIPTNIQTKGIELEIAGALSDKWDIYGGYTFNAANDDEGEQRENYVPRHTFKLTTNYDATDFVEGLRVGTSIRWQSKIFYESSVRADGETYPFTQKNDAYFLVDLMASYNLSEELSFNFNLYNTFNQYYSRSIWGYADVGEPRRFAASVRYRF